MLGENELVKLFPDFKDLVQPSGIDLALDKIYTQESEGSLIDNEKNLPEIKELEGPVYTLKPHTAYLASIDRKIKIPKGYSMLYLVLKIVIQLIFNWNMEIIFNIDNRQVSVFAFDSCLNKIKWFDLTHIVEILTFIITFLNEQMYL